MKKCATFARQTEGQRAHEAPQRCSKGRIFLQQLDYAAIKIRPATTRIYNSLEPYIARTVPTSGSLMVHTSKKEDERSPVIRGETAAAFEAKPAARAQPMSALPNRLLASSNYLFMET